MRCAHKHEHAHSYTTSTKSFLSKSHATLRQACLQALVPSHFRNPFTAPIIASQSLSDVCVNLLPVLSNLCPQFCLELRLLLYLQSRLRSYGFGFGSGFCVACLLLTLSCPPLLDCASSLCLCSLHLCQALLLSYQICLEFLW